MAVESAYGREREGERNAPRTLDVDLIVVGDRRADEEDLVLPHPRAAERAFVLVPWLDLEPEAEIPGVGPVAELVEKTGREGVAPARGHRARVPLTGVRADGEPDPATSRTRSRTRTATGHASADRTRPAGRRRRHRAGAAAGRSARSALRFGYAEPDVSFTSIGALFFVAAIIGGTAYVTRRTVRRNRSTSPTTRR